jgi:hypothetical protein
VIVVLGQSVMGLVLFSTTTITLHKEKAQKCLHAYYGPLESSLTFPKPLFICKPFAKIIMISKGEIIK